MENKARRLLMDRLDDSLIIHASMMNPQNIASIYDLQQLTEIHCYLKTEHHFTPAEVEALWKFEDPLDVVRWCWEDNPHKHSFPICDLLNSIGAWTRFPLVEVDCSVRGRLAQARNTVKVHPKRVAPHPKKESR